jgi:hypothetical protein
LRVSSLMMGAPQIAEIRGRAMGTQPPRYLAYLVRLWQVQDRGVFVWRASLEDAHTGERHGFSDVKSLFAFLAEQAAGPNSCDARPPGLRHPRE